MLLGLSAAVFGPWLDRVGPRKAMFAAACCFGGGFLVSALGVHLHQLWLIYLGYGVLGGCGLGIGYISPVSTLINWFPDRPGMATGLAIMGFGGGAMIASPLSVRLMAAFSTPDACRRAPRRSSCWACLFLLHVLGAASCGCRREGWRPAGYRRARAVERNDYHRERASGHRDRARRSSGCCGWCCA